MVSFILSITYDGELWNHSYLTIKNKNSNDVKLQRVSKHQVFMNGSMYQ